MSRDSAGIVIVENGELADADSLGWTIDREPTLSIGQSISDEPYLFTHIVGFRRWSDGGVAIVDRETRQTRMFDATGRFLASVGRPGQGPEEFGPIRQAVRAGSDLLIVVEGERGGRLTVIDQSGTIKGRHYLGVADSPNPPLGRFALPSLAFADGSFLVITPTTECGTEVGRLCESRGWFRRVTPDSLLAASFGELTTSRSEFYQRPARMGSFILYDFASPPFWATRGMQFYYSDSYEFEIRVFSGDGGLERIVRAQTPRLTADKLPQRKRKAIQADDPSIPEYLRPSLKSLDSDFADAWRNAERPALLRAHDGLLVDAAGNMWVKEYLVGRDPPATGARWWVFDSTGVLRHALRMPPIDIHQTPEDPEPVEIGHDYILAVASDESGVERVVLYRIRKREMEGG